MRFQRHRDRRTHTERNNVEDQQQLKGAENETKDKKL